MAEVQLYSCELTPSQCRELRGMIKGRCVDSKTRVRARILLALSGPRHLPEVAAEVGCSLDHVRRTWRRFQAEGEIHAAVIRRPRIGRPSLVSPATGDEIAQLATQRPSWGCRSIAALAVRRGLVRKLSHETCRQILLSRGIRRPRASVQGQKRKG